MNQQWKIGFVILLPCLESIFLNFIDAHSPKMQEKIMDGNPDEITREMEITRHQVMIQFLPKRLMKPQLQIFQRTSRFPSCHLIHVLDQSRSQHQPQFPLLDPDQHQGSILVCFNVDVLVQPRVKRCRRLLLRQLSLLLQPRANQFQLQRPMSTPFVYFTSDQVRPAPPHEPTPTPDEPILTPTPDGPPTPTSTPEEYVHCDLEPVSLFFG